MVLGKACKPESSGPLGCALLSAPTLRQALTALRNCAPLSFAPCRVDFLAGEQRVLLGYSAPGNFSDVCKRWHGSSPREYRQSMR